MNSIYVLCYVDIALIAFIIALFIIVYVLNRKIDKLLSLNDSILKHNSGVLTQLGNVIDQGRNLSNRVKIIESVLDLSDV